MKKWLISLMMILCVFSFTACGSAAGEDAAASEVTEEIEQKLLDAGVYTVQSIQSAVESGEEIQIDDEVLMAGIESWKSALEDIGTVEGITGDRVEVTDDGYTIYINIDGTDHDAEAARFMEELEQQRESLPRSVRKETADMDKELSSLSAGQPVPMLERVILDALRTKKNVVEQDEKEHGLRRVLNFGHTLGHGIESLHEENGLLHGECVALGMLPMCSSAVRERLLPVLERLGLPVTCSADPERVMQAVVHDKKLYAGKVHTIFVEEVGSFTERDLSPEELKSLYQQYFFA